MQEKQLLEYDKFLQLLTEYTPNPQTKQLINSLNYQTDRKKVKKSIKRTSQFLSVLEKEGYIPLSTIPDISQSLELLSIQDSILSPQDLLDIGAVLKISRELKRFLSEGIQQLDEVQQLYRELFSSRETERIIEDSIDRSGMVKDTASRDLAKIRRSIKEVEKQIVNHLEGIIHSQKYADIIQEKIITVRRDRYVIPVKQTFSSKIQGIIQDRSASGQTVYLEPTSVVYLNNRLSELKLSEQIEIRKILKFLTDIVRTKYHQIKKSYHTLIQFDYLYTVGKYAREFKATFPEISQEVNLKKAKHPIFLILGKEFKPIDLILNSEKRGLIITGPNTGGKTVALKTMGLLSMLVQTGIPIPVEEGSSIPIFSGIFADIGDMQSIENDLSTFSAHITNIKSILSKVSDTSLVLLDELVAGTDPDEGSALGIGILEYLKEKNSYLIATTHFKQIKVYALSQSYFSVASVGFDKEKLTPTYTLHYNSVGQSMAFYIAERLGLDKKILQTAKQYLNEDYLKLQEAVETLEKYKTEYEKKLSQMEETLQKLKQEKEKYEKLNKQLQKEKEKQWQSVKEEVNRYLKQVREEGYSILQRIKETPSGKELEDFIKREKTKILQPKKGEEKSGEIQIGDFVRLKGSNMEGKVLSIREGKAHIDFGKVKIWAYLNKLEKVKHKEDRKKVKFTFSKQRDTSFKPEINIIGKTREEALKELELFLDRAITEGFSTVRIIHGYGSGILRKAVREYLDSLPYKLRYEDAPYQEGGMAITVVHFL
ncbi:MAG: endonuclease MutS2 [Aquificae bacterium]|nr:endonuclease MutS2 [Aquificota bacterium]